MIAYNVAQRTHELGVRVALGAQSHDLLGLVVGGGMRLAVVGLAIGLAVALAAGRYVGPLLVGVRPADPWVFGAVAGVLLAVALLASVIPAWRASRVDPSVALRADRRGASLREPRPRTEVERTAATPRLGDPATSFPPI